MSDKRFASRDYCREGYGKTGLATRYLNGTKLILKVSVMSSGASFGNKEKDVEMLDVPTVRAPESEHAPRAYQLDIVDEAKRANVIALLPTGAGKTFVATLVIKAKADLLLHQKQLAVFVVPRKVRPFQWQAVFRSSR
ncbi:hypothetical protein CYMTET_14948 [Cymbomonas tetramitiformis]|uniref:Helicase/UvrB N-terminal domain-containing protein n=1 Tax=Cymbomonas tetramitiformis TaxID=36881 RepID=A0AAE0L9U4_9CHLO|nr:hypothetical protein CYMTET_14948 [Cymbomonas tetramitiformis]